MEIRVRPGSSRREVAGMAAGRIVVCVHSPPEKGRASREALQVLAEALGLPPSRLEVVRGNQSRNKTVLARGLSLPEVRERLGPVVMS